MPVPEGSISHPTTAIEDKAGIALSKEDLSAIYRDLTSPGYPTAPPNSAVPRKIRLVHSAPKSVSRSELFDGENKESSKESHQNENEKLHNDSTQHSTTHTPHPVYTPVYFQIAKSKDILNSNPKQISGVTLKKSSESPLKEMTMETSNILNYKPGYSRYPSPKKVKFLETYFQKNKSIEEGTPVTEKTIETDAHSARSSSTRTSEGSRRNLNMSHCEAMYLSDLKQTRNSLNRSLSKSVHSLNVAPRPVAAFPSKPLKAGSFVLARRKGKGDLDRATSQVCLNDIKITPDLSVYSISSMKKSTSDNADAESVLPSLEDLGLNENSSNLPKKPGLETPVPYNSCKSSMIGSEVFGRPESVLATRGTMRPWSGTVDDISETHSDISFITKRTDGQTTSRSTATTRKSSPVGEESQKSLSSKSPRASVSTNAFRPSKSVHKINASQAYANYNAKSKNGSNEKHKAVIMDIFKKRGMKAPNLDSSNQNIFTEDDKIYMSYAGYREGRKQKRRSRSLGRDATANNKSLQDQMEFKSNFDISQEAYRPHPLAILASRGGRDVLFNSRNSYKIGTDNRSEKIVSTNERVLSAKKNNVNTEISSEDQELKQSSQPTVTFSDKLEKKTITKTSSFQKLNKKAVPETAGNSTEAMFDSSHYTGFQHSKFRKKEKNIKDTRRKQPGNTFDIGYKDSLKTKFLKVSVGGVGTGIPSESMDSPRSSELTVS